MKRVLALTAILCMVCACAMAAAPGKLTGPEGGIKYASYGNHIAVQISLPGEYTIENWTVNDEYELIRINESLTGSVKLTLKNVYLKSKMAQGLIWNKDYGIKGSRSLTLVFENSQIHADTGVAVAALDDGDCTLTIAGSKPTITGTLQGVRISEPDTPAGERKGRSLIDIAADDAVITGGLLYGVSVEGKKREACEVRITGKNAKISANNRAVSVEHFDGNAFVGVTGEGALLTGAQGSVYMDGDENSELTLGADVTLTGRQTVELYDDNGRVLLDGRTWRGICAEIADNMQGDHPAVYGPYGALTVLDFANDVKEKQYLHTFVTEMPPEDPGDGGNEGVGVPGEVMPEPDELPKTGDAHSIALYIALLAAGVMGVVMMLRRREA